MEARRALVVAIVAALAAVGIVAADTAFGLKLRVDAQDGGEWRTVWVDPSRQNAERYVSYPEPYGNDCAARTFRVVAENDKPFPESLTVKVTYWDNATKRTTTLQDDTLALGAFETKTLEFTVPATAGPGPGEFPRDDYKPPAFATIVFDGGWPAGGTETQVCVGGGR